VTDGASARPGQPATMRPGPRPDATRIRLFLAGLLILLVIVGIRALPALGWHQSWRGPWHAQGTAIAICTEVALAGLLGGLLRQRSRHPQAGWRAARLRAWLTTLLPAIMILCGFALLRFITLPRASPHPRPKQPRVKPPPNFSASGVRSRLFSPDIATAIEYAALAMIIISLLIAALVLLSRLRRAVRRERLVVSADDADVVREAVEAGRTALTGVSDARLAIIACYLAMERSLGQAGTARAATETAHELLARATAAGLLHGAAPADLTALFSAARFSRHEVPESARTRALAALNLILADIGETGHGEPGHGEPGRGGPGQPSSGNEAVAP
jgi:ABC-type uncharacterized transport system YnjBCD permease subunit